MLTRTGNKMSVAARELFMLFCFLVKTKVIEKSLVFSELMKNLFEQTKSILVFIAEDATANSITESYPRGFQKHNREVN